MMGALSIDWAPLVPWLVLAALASAALPIVGFAVWRRARGAWWRALTAAALLLALANPSLVEEQRDPLEDVVLVVVDESPSQGIDPRTAQTEAAVEQMVRELGALPNTEVRVVRAGADALALDKDGTRLFTELRQAMAKVPRQRIGGVIAISDGQVHDVPESLEALGLDAPLHLLLTGAENEGDRRLTIAKVPSFGIVGKPLSLTLTVEDLPTAAGPRLVRVIVRQDGAVEQILQVPVGVEQTVDIDLDHRGPNVLDIEVEPGPRELSLANNRAAVVINGVRDRLRVLLVSGEPHAGERAWRNILKSDPSVDLVHFTILRPPEKQDGTPIRELSLIAFPTRELFEVKLGEFDLIIFDRYRRRGVVPLTYLGNIARYVEKGGALLTAVGPAFATPFSLDRTPLSKVLPAHPTGEVFEGGFRARLTRIGRRHPVTARLPGAGGETPTWGRWFRQIDADAERGAVLMQGVEDQPILILDRVDQGRVAQLLTDHIWLWARGYEGGGPQAELLRRLAHWLMKEPDLEEEALRATSRGNRIEIARRSLDPVVAPVEVTAPSGAVRRVTLEDAGDGRATATLAVDEPGLYRLTDGRRSAMTVVGEVNPREFADLRATEEALAPLARATGGALAWLADAPPPAVRMVRPGRDTAGRGWIGLKANRDYVVTGIRRGPLMPEWLVLLLGLGGLMLAWRAEGD